MVWRQSSLSETRPQRPPLLDRDGLLSGTIYQWGGQDAIFATIADIANMAIDAKLLKTEHAAHISREFVQDAVAKPKRRTKAVKEPALKPPK